MKKILLFAAFALSFSLMSSLLVPQAYAFVPEWERTWGGGVGPAFEDADEVAVDPMTGDIYVVGHTWSFGTGGLGDNADAFILKYNSVGDLLWERTWGGPSFDGAFGVAVDPISNFPTTYVYVVGDTDGFGQGSFDAFILKFDQMGNLMWERTWGGLGWDEAMGVEVDLMTGDIYVVGTTSASGFGSADALILQLHPDGSLGWQQKWGASGADILFEVTVGPKGIYVVGRTSSLGTYADDACILKFDPVGNLLWQRTWGGPGYEEARGVAVWIGRIYVVGWTESFGAGDYDAFILGVIDGGKNPHLKAQKTWGGTGFDWASSVTLGHSHFIFVVGSTYSFGPGTPSEDSFALQFRPHLKLVSEIAWGGSKSDWALDVEVDPMGGFIYVVGATPTPFPPSYQTPVGGTVMTAGGTLDPASGTVTPAPGILDTPPLGNVGYPSGSTNFADGHDAALLKIEYA